MWSYGAPCLWINPQTVLFSAIDVLHVSSAEESCRQIHQSWACGKLPDELPQVINACNHLWVDSNPGMIQIAAVVETFELLHRHMIDLSHIDVSLTDGWGSRWEPGSLCRFTCGRTFPQLLHCLLKEVLLSRQPRTRRPQLPLFDC